MSNSPSTPLSGRLLGIGRRTTLPVQPISAGNSIDSPATTAISSTAYKPPPTLAQTFTKLNSTNSPTSRPSSRSIHHVKSLTMDNSPSPFQPETSSRSSVSPRGGRLNELLNLGRSRAASADSYGEASNASVSSESSGGSSAATTPHEADLAAEERMGAMNAPSVMRQLIRAGQLRKRSPRGLQLWQSRYCWLYSDTLQYSKTRDSRAMQGAIPLAAIKVVQSAKVTTAAASGSAGDKQKRRFDVLISNTTDDKSGSDGRWFHFEASTEHDADEWVIALTQACRKASIDEDGRRVTVEGEKFWKTDASRSGSGRLTISANRLPPQPPSRVSLSQVARPSSAERRKTDGAAVVQQAMSQLGKPSSAMSSSVSASHWSLNSNSPSSPSVADGGTGTISPVRAPTVHGYLPPALLSPPRSADSPASDFVTYSIVSISSRLPSAGSLASLRYGDDRSSPLPPAAPHISAMLDVIQRIDFHPIGDWFLCRDKAATNGAWYLMHATHQSHPLFASVHAATVATPTFVDSQQPCMLQRLAAFTSADAVFALYTPAFRPSDTLLSYLHAHRRLPEPVVRYVAVHVIRAVMSLHANLQSYPLLSPASLAFDGEGAVYLIDPVPTLSSRAQLPEYQLHSDEHESGRADWWRLGVLLYELAVGFPPVRAEGDEEDEWQAVAHQLESFHPMTLLFPPFVPAGLQSLIRQLLMAELDDRLGCGELADAEITQHAYFEGVLWTADVHDSLAPPPWVRQHVLKQPTRISLTAKSAASQSQSQSTVSSGSSSTASTPVHITRPHASSAFTFSPHSTSPTAERKLFFPANQQAGGLTSIDSYMQQQKPPRHLLRLPSASSLATSPSSSAHQRPSSLYLTLLGGRGFPLPKEDAAAASTSSLQRIKRRTLGERGASKDGASAQQGVYVAVECVGEEEAAASTERQRVRTSRLVVGPAACQPSFGDSFLFSLPDDDQRFDDVQLSLEIRHARVGSPLTGDSGALGQLVGSVSVPVRSVQSAVVSSDEVWHSVISGQGLVVGEVHVKYAFTYEQAMETSRRQWWTAAEVRQDGTFESLFGVQLTVTIKERAAEVAGQLASEAVGRQLSVVVEASEDTSRPQSVCLPAGSEAQLMLNARALDNDNQDSHSAPTTPLSLAELFEPQERAALANIVYATTATLQSTRPTAADSRLLRSALCDNKQRAELNGISVDLSNITPHLIVFGSPVNIPALTTYRNPLSHIQLYLQAAYPAADTPSSDGPTIRIYNLNTDASSALIASLGSSTLAFAATAVPSFDALLRWCGETQSWLRGGKGRVAAVHCLSGVWRCCVVICAYLLFDNQVATVADAVSLYCRHRLTPTAAASFSLLPSHRRWLEYMERYAAKLRRASFSNLQPPPSLALVHRTLQLTHVRLTGLSTSVTNPLWGGNDHASWYIIVHSTAGVQLYDSRALGTTAAIREKRNSGGGRDVVTSGCEVSGDWRLSVCCEAEVRVSCWLHQFFVGDECYVKLRGAELEWPAGSYKRARTGSTSAVDDVSVECFFLAAA